MNLREFKYWFIGFNDFVGETPTPEQYKKIIQKISEIKETCGCHGLLPPWPQATLKVEPWPNGLPEIKIIN